MAYQCRQLPIAGRAVVAQDEAPIVVDLDLEIAVRGIQPAVENLDHREAPFAERESAGLLLASMARVAFHPYFHTLIERYGEDALAEDVLPR